MDVTLIDDWSAAAPLAEEWNALALRAEASQLFQTYEWHDAWWRSFGDGERLMLLVARRDGALAGIAPMMISEEKFQRRNRRVLRFIGTKNYSSDYANFIVEDRSVAELFVDEIVRRGGWHIAELQRLPTHTSWRAAIVSRLAAALPVVSEEIETEAPTRLLGDPEADREVLNKKSLKRHVNHFQKAGGLTFTHVDDAARIIERMGDFFGQHVERRRLAGGESQFLDHRQQDFYRRLVPALLSRGWLRFAIVEANGVPLAYHFGFEFRRVFIWYKPTFNVEYLRKSPGEVLIWFLMRDAIERKLAEFDFTVGEESFKYRFANLVRTNTRVRAFRSRIDGWLYRGVERLRPIVRKIRAAIRSRAAKPSAQTPQRAAEEQAQD